MCKKCWLLLRAAMFGACAEWAKKLFVSGVYFYPKESIAPPNTRSKLEAGILAA